MSNNKIHNDTTYSGVVEIVLKNGNASRYKVKNLPVTLCTKSAYILCTDIFTGSLTYIRISEIAKCVFVGKKV